MNYYNEFDPNAAAWLRELIAEGLIPKGDVDDRSIADVAPRDLRGYAQCHFFAGIGGWSYALQLAGWDADRPVWTGSCPCQAFSTAGKQKGFADERDLWPVFFKLIRECRPEYVFGEQVENAIKHGWLDRVYTDLEGEGYSCGAVVLGAHSVGAPHQRQRLYWGCTLAGIPDTDTEQRYRSGETRQTGRGEPANGSNGYCSKVSGNSHNTRFQDTSSDRNKTKAIAGGGNDSRRISYAQSQRFGEEWSNSQRFGEEWSNSQRSTERTAGSSADHALADNSIIGSEAGVSRQNKREERQSGILVNGGIQGIMEHTANDGLDGVYPECGGLAEERGMLQPARAGNSGNTWQRCRHLMCQDGAIRRVPFESLFLRVADGFPEIVDGCGDGGISEENGFPLTRQKEGRPMLLKGYGNAIVPQVAAEFVKAFEEAMCEK